MDQWRLAWGAVKWTLSSMASANWRPALSHVGRFFLRNGSSGKVIMTMAAASLVVRQGIAQLGMA